MLRQDILDAALRCIARVGLAKTTIDDVAREAGCSRATLYRSFPGKQPLLVAAVTREAERLQAEVLSAAASTNTLADAAVAVVTTGSRLLADHEALRFVFMFEPEAILPYVSFERGDVFLQLAGAHLAPAFERFVGADAPRLAEWLVRLSFSYLSDPEEQPLVDIARARPLVEDFVLPGLVQGVTQ